VFNRLLPLILILSAMRLGSAATSEWHQDTHSSSTIQLEDNIWVFNGPNNLHSHIERPAPELPAFRASASIKAPPASELSPALFLYWKPGTWIRIGYIAGNDIYHVHGPGIYGIVCQDGKETRYRLTTTESSDWNYHPETGNLIPSPVDSRWNNVALLVTENQIHFQLKGDTGEWETVQKFERVPGLESPPREIILGKGYYASTSHSSPDLDNDLADPGPEATAYIKNIKIESASDSDITDAARPGEYYHDVYGRTELDKPGDPTYDSVAAIWPALQYGRDALSVPNHRHEFAILPDGQIGMWPDQDTFPTPGKGNKAWFLIGQERQRFGHETTVSRSLEKNYLPILSCTYHFNGLKYSQTMSAWSQAMSPDATLHGIIKTDITNETTTSATTRLSFFGEKEKTELIRWENISLQPAETRSFYSDILFQENGTSLTVSQITADQYDAKVAEVRATWEKLINQGMQIHVPEPRVANAWKAWTMWVYMGVDKINSHYEFHDGAGGFYELLYGISAARGSQIFDLLNRTEDSRKWLDCMLNMVDKDGLFLVNSGLPDQGALMQSVSHHFTITHDTKWLKEISPILLRMCNWVREKRSAAKTETPTTSPVHGLIKARPYCDHPNPEYYFVSDIYVANGLHYIADALRQIDMTAEAAWIDDEAKAYTYDIQQALSRSVFEFDGAKLLPLFPETRELLRATGWMASNYYSLLAPCLLDNGGSVLTPDSHYATMIVNALEERGGLLMGLCRFWGGIDHAYTAGYWYHRLVNGEPEKALLGLYASMAYGMSRDTFSSVEVTFAKDGKNFATLPHNFSNQEQLRLVRNLLVTETTDTLLIGAGMSRNWLASGQPVGVENAGTTWGNLSYEMKSVDDRTIEFHLIAPASVPEGGIRIFFRHPNAATIKNIEVTGATVKTQDAESVTILPTESKIRIKALY